MYPDVFAATSTVPTANPGLRSISKPVSLSDASVHDTSARRLPTSDATTPVGAAGGWVTVPSIVPMVHAVYDEDPNALSERTRYRYVPGPTLSIHAVDPAPSRLVTPGPQPDAVSRSRCTSKFVSLAELSVQVTRRCHWLP